MTEGKNAARVKMLAAVMLFMFAALTTRLWFLQVLAAEEYQTAAEGNRVRIVPEPAPRGRIMDRNGELLVENATRYVITVNRQRVKNREELLRKLSKLLGVSAEELGEAYDNRDYGPFDRVPILENADKDDILYLAEHSREYPGVGYRAVGVRRYRHGDLAAHVLGYLGQIGEGELGTPAFEGYRPGQQVGRGGVEQQYERFLHGRDGWHALEVDARGRQVAPARVVEEPVPGHDLVLTLDRTTQQLAEETLAEGVSRAKQIVHAKSGSYLRAPAGAMVVLDVNTGEVLAMASYPSYDPGVFLRGLTQREWEKLNDPKRNFPLNNRATQSSYPPGSIIKPFMGAAAVKAGFASPNGFYPCPPDFTVEGDTSETVWRNWKDTHSGIISFGQALVESCDTVFYRFGLDFYRERRIRGELMQQALRGWGLDQPTGLDLPFESKGRVPDADWKARIHQLHPDLFPDAVWYPGDTINMSIGQGDLLSTPLQMAVAYAALGNGGERVTPHVAMQVQDHTGKVLRTIDPPPRARVDYPKKLLNRIRRELQPVVSSGTAGPAFVGFPLGSVPIAGKTGTSEVPNKQPHSWFAAVAPADKPKYAVVVIVEEGGHGSEVAAPMVRRMLEGLFGLEHTPFRVGPATD